MSQDIDFVSEDLFRTTFSYFGMKISGVMFLAGILVSGLGLEEVINPILWTLCCVSGLVVAYALRSYIGISFLGWLLLTSFVLALVSIAGILLHVNRPDLSQAFLGQPALVRNIITFFPGVILVTLIGLTVVAYRKRDEFVQSNLPRGISDILDRYITGPGLYYPQFKYKLVARRLKKERKLEIQMICNFTVCSFNDNEKIFISEFPKSTDGFDVVGVAVDGVVQPASPLNQSESGMHLRVIIPPHGEREICVETIEQFDERDSDRFTAYDYPASVMDFELDYSACPDMQFWLESLNSQKNLWQEDGTKLTWSSEGAILPFQGIRLIWRPRP